MAGEVWGVTVRQGKNEQEEAAKVCCQDLMDDVEQQLRSGACQQKQILVGRCFKVLEVL